VCTGESGAVRHAGGGKAAWRSNASALRHSGKLPEMSIDGRLRPVAHRQRRVRDARRDEHAQRCEAIFVRSEVRRLMPWTS
jgi:hypothetical protein